MSSSSDPIRKLQLLKDMVAAYERKIASILRDDSIPPAAFSEDNYKRRLEERVLLLQREIATTIRHMPQAARERAPVPAPAPANNARKLWPWEYPLREEKPAASGTTAPVAPAYADAAPVSAADSSSAPGPVLVVSGGQQLTVNPASAKTMAAREAVQAETLPSVGDDNGNDGAFEDVALSGDADEYDIVEAVDRWESCGGEFDMIDEAYASQPPPPSPSPGRRDGPGWGVSGAGCWASLVVAYLGQGARREV